MTDEKRNVCMARIFEEKPVTTINAPILHKQNIILVTQKFYAIWSVAVARFIEPIARTSLNKLDLHLSLKFTVVGYSFACKQFQRVSTILIKTRLPSNLRPTTRECVHLVTRGHF